MYMFLIEINHWIQGKDPEYQGSPNLIKKQDEGKALEKKSLSQLIAQFQKPIHDIIHRIRGEILGELKKQCNFSLPSGQKPRQMEEPLLAIAMKEFISQRFGKTKIEFNQRDGRILSIRSEKICIEYLGFSTNLRLLGENPIIVCMYPDASGVYVDIDGIRYTNNMIDVIGERHSVTECCESKLYPVIREFDRTKIGKEKEFESLYMKLSANCFTKLQRMEKLKEAAERTEIRDVIDLGEVIETIESYLEF